MVERFVVFISWFQEDDIVKYLDEIVSEIDSMILEKQNVLADLESYKRALIYETVTGKRKVV